MGKSNKRNDIILRNILNIAKIKPKDKLMDKKKSEAKRLEVDKNKNLKSSQLVIRNIRDGRASGFENRDLSLKFRDIGDSQCLDKCERNGSDELNNNSICTDLGDAANRNVCNLSDLDYFIQNQYDILNKAVTNILAVSSDDIYAKHEKDNKDVSCALRENITKKKNNFASIVEDLEFKEALCRFSEESFSMSAENLLQKTSFNQVSRKKPTHKSLNTFDLVAKDRHGGGSTNRRRSSSRRRESRQRRELSLGSSTPTTEQCEARSGRFKDTRRQQTSHVSSSDSEAEDGHARDRAQDKLSFTEYKRRRRQRDNRVSGSGQDLSSSSRRSKLSTQSLRSSESSLAKLRGSPEHIYQSIGSDIGFTRATSTGDNTRLVSDLIKNENHDSGRSISPPTRRFFSREGSAESSGHTSGISLQYRSNSLRSLSRESKDRNSTDRLPRRRSFLLNTSYSSEELVTNGSTGSDVNPNPNFTRISPATRSLRLPPSVPVTSVGDLVSSSPPVDHLTSPDLLTRVHLTPPVSPARSNRDLSSRPPRDTGLSSVTSDLATVKANRRSPEETVERRPRRFSDLLLPPPVKQQVSSSHPESPGSVFSPPTPGSASANKPPIFSSPDVKNCAFKFSLKLKSESSLSVNKESFKPDSVVTGPVAAAGTASDNSTGTSTTSTRPDPEKVKRRRSFNPNEPAPPRPTHLTRPHSVYRMENQNNKISDHDLRTKGEKERRKSDFLSRYEELTCRAALAIKSVDQIVKHDRNDRNIINPNLESPITPDVESVEFNEEEVLKTCQDFLDDYDKSKVANVNGKCFPTPRIPPIPAPRLSLANRVDFPSSRHQTSSLQPKLSKEDEDLLEAAQEKSFWDTKHCDNSVFERLENVNPEAFDSKIIRTRSSSLTIHDKCEEKIKPILKKSTEDLAEHEHNRFPSILKTRDDFGLIPKTKHEGKYEHVRIRSPSFDRNEHVRIRSPSPDFENETIDLCDDDDIDGRSSSPENPSILRNRFRRTSVDGITFDDLNDEPQSILKRKSSFGSGSHSPEGNSENTRSILKKSSRNSSRTCSRSGSIEELDVESTKSILKSRNSSRTCSRSGSQEELDLDFDDEWETRPKSILKKKSGSTDDELDERPKSILKSRRSEESLSPNSDQVETPSHSILRDGRSSSGTRQSSIISDNEEILVISGRNSPSLRISGRSSPLVIEEPNIPPRPILKNRDEMSGLHGILKKREKSSSPVGRHSSPDSPHVPRIRDLSCPGNLEMSTQATPPLPSEPKPEPLSQNPASSLPTLPPSPSLPPPVSAVLGPSISTRHRGRRKQNLARFQTQPITVDEVEMARNRRDGSSTPEAPIRPNQFLHSFSSDLGSVFTKQKRPPRLCDERATMSSSSQVSLSSTSFLKSSLSIIDQPTFQDSVRASPARIVPPVRSDISANSSEEEISLFNRDTSNDRGFSAKCTSSPPPPTRTRSPSASRQSPTLPRKLPHSPITAGHPPRRSLSIPSPSPDNNYLLQTEALVPKSSPTYSRIYQRTPSLDDSSSYTKPTSRNEEIPGILKNSSDPAQNVPLNCDSKTPTKSILKVDPALGGVSRTSKNEDAVETGSSSSSTEDLARSFTDVIIDPLPGQGRRSAPETPIKKFSGRSGILPTTCYPPQSLNISADGDLASKLARLAGEADCIKQKMSDGRISNTRLNVFQKSSSVDCESSKSTNRSRSASPKLESDEVTKLETTSNSIGTFDQSITTNISPDLPPQPTSRNIKSPSVQRKSSRASDLPAASEFYAIFKQAKRRSSSPGPGGSGGDHSSRSSSSSSLNLASSSSPGADSSSVFNRVNGERRSFRQRSVSPHCRKSVDFWEQKTKDERRGRSQERCQQSVTEMPEKAEIKVAGGGLAERLAALKQAGEEGWKKRVKKDPDTPEISIKKLPKKESETTAEPVTLRAPSSSGRPVSLVDRLSKLNAAQNEWQKKVGEKDTEKFTVAGKMEREKFIKSPDSSTPTAPPVKPAPVIEKFIENTGQKFTPKMSKFKGSTSGQRDRPLSFVETNSTSSFVRTGSTRKPDIKSVETKTVTVPQHDPDTLDKFFNSKRTHSNVSGDDNLDFDDILVGEPLLNTRRKINKPKRNKVSKNPVKNLAARTDLMEEYTEDLFIITEKEHEKENVEVSSVHSHLASEALAGLASTEDFTSIKLSKGRAVPNQNMLPYREKMLIQVKGRRFCQSRVVPPVGDSLNSGDCYILVTPSQIFNWQGKFSNVIERSRSAEIAATILQRKDLGSKSTAKVETIEEEKLLSCGKENRRFWKCLTGSEEVGKAKEAGPPEEDEDYEQTIVETTCVYEVNIDNDELVPVEAAWGCPPKYEHLHANKVLVFDFGSEVYVYNGKNAPFETRKVGARLAQELWNSGWNYTGCNMNPVYGDMTSMVRESSRPGWTILGRINSCMETILFREKFLDWPDKTRVIGSRAGDKDKDDIIDVNVSPQWAWADLQGVDGDEVIAREEHDPDLELENAHLGRGRGYYDQAEMRQYEVTTLAVTAWHVEDSDYTCLPDTWRGQFHTEDTYVVRWKYKVALTGRALQMMGGGASKHKAVGRDRCAYFFWQGRESKMSKQGASALHTVELDSEKGPQLRVREGKEHAAFLSLFDGNMVILKGARGASVSSRLPRLFVIQGNDDHEKYAKEVICDTKSLRSRGVFLLMTGRKLLIWFGRFASSEQKKFGSDIASRWNSSAPPEMDNVKITNVETLNEGEESSDFWEAIGGSSSQYQTLSRADVELKSSTRLYHMTSVLGTFEVNEVKSDSVKLGSVNNLLHSQFLLYEAEQPALFMLDAGQTLYLWQGWFPVDTSDTSDDSDTGNIVTTGSGTVRWQAERRAAMQTVLSYRSSKYGRRSVEARLVWAGHEPQEFINLFPDWQPHTEVAKINKEMIGSADLESTYADLSRTEYSWEELKVRPLPPGVDPAKIETYLSNDVFLENFKMSKSEFNSCPRWKQIEMKKETGLF